MADAKISALDTYTTPISTDVLPIVDVTSGITKRITALNLNLGAVVEGVTSSLGANAVENIFTLVTDSTYVIHVKGNSDGGYYGLWLVIDFSQSINATKIAGHATLSLEYSASDTVALRTTAGHSGQTYTYRVRRLT